MSTTISYFSASDAGKNRSKKINLPADISTGQVYVQASIYEHVHHTPAAAILSQIYHGAIQVTGL
jgi:hypothetical protein